MRVDLVTKEYPPQVYGGAGVHITELTRALRACPGVEARVHAFGEPNAESHTRGYVEDAQLAQANTTLSTLAVDLSMAAQCADTQLVHSHTWYANFAGHVVSLLYQVPHVITAHSLEPLRPWKAEQLGGGYQLSKWIEASAYQHASGIIAVSEGMRRDIERCYPQVDPHRIHVVHNGVDTSLWQPSDQDSAEQAARSYGIDPDLPTVIFVGRITRQKGLLHLLRAATHLAPSVQLVLCAAAPDTPELAHEVREQIATLRQSRQTVWIAEMLPREQLSRLLSVATVFACPSIYEPLGIVNLEAMACELPVVASEVGGIPEVVLDRETGFLVPVGDSDETGEPLDAADFALRFARALMNVIEDPARARTMGIAGRARAEQAFAWPAIAQQTLSVYRAAQQVHA